MNVNPSTNPSTNPSDAMSQAQVRALAAALDSGAMTATPTGQVLQVPKRWPVPAVAHAQPKDAA